MYFSLSINLIIWCLLAFAAGVAIVEAVWLWSRTRRIDAHVSGGDGRGYVDDLPSVSVVVYAHNDAQCLEKFLPLILAQDYPDFEVIVVDDGSIDNSAMLLSEFKAQYSNLQLSFTPRDTRQLSRKKLSVMLGIKAAKKDVIINTTANTRVMSDQWLRLMMRNFTPETQVVLGYSHYRYRRDRKPGRWYRVWDTLTTATEWINSALKGNPYRGTAENLAYRRRVFFDNRGFANSMELHWGDDDIFVSEIANGANTRVELDADAQVITYYENTAKAHHRLRLRRDFTTSFLRRKQAYVQSIMSVLNYLRLAAVAGAVALDYRNAFVVALALVLEIATWIPAINSWRRTASLLGAPKLLLSVPLYALWRPVVNVLYKVRGRRHRKSNYTSVFE